MPDNIFENEGYRIDLAFSYTNYLPKLNVVQSEIAQKK